VLQIGEIAAVRIGLVKVRVRVRVRVRDRVSVRVS